MNNLVLITQDKFDVDLDIRYAGKNNIIGQKLYKEALCYLHTDAVACLKKSIKLASKKNYRIKIFDCFRPIVVQRILFDKCKNFPGLVSNPDNGPIPHCRGVAIDLTLVNRNSGYELDMGTDFDDVTELAYHDCKKVSKVAIKNRSTLKEIMINSGWDFYQREWWHYQLFNPRQYQIIDDSALNLTGL